MTTVLSAVMLLLAAVFAGPAAAQLYDAPPPPGSAFVRVFNNSASGGLAGTAGDLLRDRHLVEAAYFGSEQFADTEGTLAG